jgi:hypothetical protein
MLASTASGITCGLSFNSVKDSALNKALVPDSGRCHDCTDSLFAWFL